MLANGFASQETLEVARFVSEICFATGGCSVLEPRYSRDLLWSGRLHSDALAVAVAVDAQLLSHDVCWFNDKTNEVDDSVDYLRYKDL